MTKNDITDWCLISEKQRARAFGVGRLSVIAPPGAGRLLPEGGGWTRCIKWADFSYPIKLSQQPACSIHGGLSNEGRPVGLQIVGVRGPDKAILSAARMIDGMYPDRFLLPGTIWPAPRREHRV